MSVGTSNKRNYLQVSKLRIQMLTNISVSVKPRKWTGPETNETIVLD